MVTRLLEHEVRLREAYKARHVVLLDGEEFDEHRRRLSEQRARGQEGKRRGGVRERRGHEMVPRRHVEALAPPCRFACAPCMP